MVTKCKRVSYTAETKLQIVEKSEEVGIRAAARHFGVDEKCVRQWRSKKNELKKMDRRKYANRGSSAKWPILEENLARWVTAQREAGLPVSTISIRLKANVIAADMGYVDFQGGPSWCYRFKNRNNLSIRAENTFLMSLQESSTDATSSTVQIVGATKTEPLSLVDCGTAESSLVTGSSTEAKLSEDFLQDPNEASVPDGSRTIENSLGCNKRKPQEGKGDSLGHSDPSEFHPDQNTDDAPLRRSKRRKLMSNTSYQGVGAHNRRPKKPKSLSHLANGSREPSLVTSSSAERSSSVTLLRDKNDTIPGEAQNEANCVSWIKREPQGEPDFSSLNDTPNVLMNTEECKSEPAEEDNLEANLTSYVSMSTEPVEDANFESNNSDNVVNMGDLNLSFLEKTCWKIFMSTKEH